MTLFGIVARNPLRLSRKRQTSAMAGASITIANCESQTIRNPCNPGFKSPFLLFIRGEQEVTLPTEQLSVPGRWIAIAANKLHPSGHLLYFHQRNPPYAGPVLLKPYPFRRAQISAAASSSRCPEFLASVARRGVPRPSLRALITAGNKRS